ncbi:LysR family transcriptional regulator [Streptomyces sp. NPDC054956]
MDELPVDQVRTLLAVIDEGTFDAAAAALHVTPSAVSQRVKALEQRTGRVLLMRTKPVRATESGEVVVRFARQLARLERDPTSEGFCDAAVAGLGWAMVPEAQAAPLLEAGKLVLIAPGRTSDVPLYWQQWKLDSPALSMVADAVARAAAEALR